MPGDSACRYKPYQLGPAGHAVKNNIRALRLHRGMSIQDLAGRLDEYGWPVYWRTLNRIERGNRRVDVDELALFAKVFRVDAAGMLQPMRVPMLAAAR